MSKIPPKLKIPKNNGNNSFILFLLTPWKSPSKIIITTNAKITNTINNSNNEEKNECLEIIKEKKFTQENIQKLIKFAIDKGGIKYAENKMQELKNEAINLIENIENKEVREPLEKIIEHTMVRNY